MIEIALMKPTNDGNRDCEGPDNDEDCIHKIYKSLDVNFISIKNMKYKFAKSYKLFYFQERESSNIK